MTSASRSKGEDVASVQSRIAQILVRSRGAPVTASDETWPGVVQHYEDMCARCPDFRDERALVNDAFRAADALIAAFPGIAAHLTDQEGQNR